MSWSKFISTIADDKRDAREKFKGIPLPLLASKEYELCGVHVVVFILTSKN